MTNAQLYGTNDVPRISKEDCNKRIELLNKRLGEVSTVDMMCKNTFLITKIIKAKEFWSRLRDGE